MHTSPTRRSVRRASRGFTLVELLTVIAIIGILAAILIPTVSVALKHVRTQKTYFMLNNLVTACNMYHQEYKYWPTLTDNPPSSVDFTMQLDSPTNRPRFVRIMSNHPDGNDVKYNKKGITFFTYSDSDVSSDPATVTPIDAFGNEDLYLIFNTDLNHIGQIQPKIVNDVTMQTQAGEDVKLDPQQSDQHPVQAPCVALSPGAGGSALDIVTTWAVTPQ